MFDDRPLHLKIQSWYQESGGFSWTFLETLGRHPRLRYQGYFVDIWFLLRYGEIFSRIFWVFDDRKLAFLSVPKTGCTSIKLTLGRAYGQELDQVSVHNFIDYLSFQRDSLQGANKYYKFAFIRNPFDRLVSCYRDKVLVGQLRRGKANLYRRFFRLPANIPFPEFVRKVINTPDYLADEHFKSQYALLYQDGECLVDFIGRFEQLESDWKKIALRFDLDPKLPMSNISKNKPGVQSDFRSYYTKELIEIVYQRYRNDFEILGYPSARQELLAFLERAQT